MLGEWECMGLAWRVCTHSVGWVRADVGVTGARRCSVFGGAGTRQVHFGGPSRNASAPLHAAPTSCLLLPLSSIPAAGVAEQYSKHREHNSDPLYLLLQARRRNIPSTTSTTWGMATSTSSLW